uniref:Uncharacterized protein n=1 Tax=Oryza sativa subsp. japonica TaxID=39947 RepID=Q6K856_ORYSJ|nr:hypothetical protein [Oryza sativa Japonica Group]BAD21773.1 hypothetical protein [Oryza sativa Japonica Group]
MAEEAEEATIITWVMNGMGWSSVQAELFLHVGVVIGEEGCRAEKEVNRVAARSCRPPPLSPPVTRDDKEKRLVLPTVIIFHLPTGDPILLVALQGSLTATASLPSGTLVSFDLV